MPAEAIFSLVVGVICMLPVLIIGIVQYKSREPALSSVLAAACS